ncbi:uncharacterized protein LOC124416255 [Diprion similis]|uniref:uncharacterized protein LOC124416255 n=1 Tax=Diprion similis TaxID=362088 RepID=UPI001EF792C9|nr:uncharacterized protein LOC124416255 [Diprion similis]
MSLNHESASPKSPPIKRRRNKVRKKPPHETCEPVVTGIACVSRDRRCACCGGLLCSPEPCHNLKLPDFEDKDFLPSEVESLLSCRGTEEVNASEHQLCENSSPTLCDNGVQDECRGYSEREISRFVEIIERKLKASLRKRAGSSVCGEDPAARESYENQSVCESRKPVVLRYRKRGGHQVRFQDRKYREIGRVEQVGKARRRRPARGQDEDRLERDQGQLRGPRETVVQMVIPTNETPMSALILYKLVGQVGCLIDGDVSPVTESTR